MGPTTKEPGAAAFRHIYSLSLLTVRVLGLFMERISVRVCHVVIASGIRRGAPPPCLRWGVYGMIVLGTYPKVGMYKILLIALENCGWNVTKLPLAPL